MLAIRKTRVLAAAAAVATLLTIAASPARAETTLEVRPGLSPFYANGKNNGPREYVTRNLSTEARNQYLRSCKLRYSCYAVGEGDGQHTFFELYYCDKRTLANFLGRGAAVNHQEGGAVVELLWLNDVVEQRIKPDNVPVSVETWDPIWYIDPC
ncbi:hypothetical protein ACGFIR_09285 [Micromonospora sp. NPDC049051]|uniref:hypothetical protein n=1 Tax=unclassified Micromonospora TaxID=2617518 RepID=UPI00371869C3